MLQATLEVLSEALLHPHKLKFAGSPIGSEARDRETKTSPSGHPACGLERCQLDTCNTKKKRQSRVRIQFLAARATIISDETDGERTCLLGGGAGRSSDRSSFRVIEKASVERPNLVDAKPYRTIIRSRNSRTQDTAGRSRQSRCRD